MPGEEPASFAVHAFQDRDSGVEICEDFFAHTSSATRGEVDILLRARGVTGGPGWLIDMLSLTRLRLQTPTHHDEPRFRHDG